MGYIGAKSSVKLGIESTFGTEANVKYKIPFTSEGLNHTLETVRSEALLGLRGTKSIAPGKTGAAGSLDVEAYPSSIGVLFYLALGKVTQQDPDTTSDSGDEYSVITPIGVTEELPSATLEINHSGEAFKYLGQKVNSLSFTGNVDNIANLSVDFVGIEASTGSATEDSTMVEIDNDPYYFKELTIYTDDFTTTTDTMSEVSLTIENNLADDDYRLDGTGKRKTIDAGNLSITGSSSFIFDSDLVTNQYNEFVNFTDAALGIKLEKTSGEKLTIFLPRIKFTNMTHDIGGPGKITVSADWEALINSSGNIITVEDHTVVGY
ncbi:MAG: phage tail tube protein [Thermotogota bacterium]